MSKSYRVLLAAAFTFTPCAALLAQEAVTTTGVHSREEFCKDVLKQMDLGAAYYKANAGGMPDQQKTATYVAEQKAMGATIVKVAPKSLVDDVVQFTKVANVFYDAQLAGRQGDREAVRAASRAVSSPEHVAAAKRMYEYCGIKKAGT